MEKSGAADITHNVRFTFNGRKLHGKPGQTVAAALFLNGIKKLGVSRKLKQPRGMYCGSGRCCSCFVTVDGIDHVLSCMTLLENGMVVQSNDCDPDIRRRDDGN
ncbi:MAG TPA: (2Fe-2S)-binding protein [Bacillota bacterium]|nr:(2Fe-2S)-binding protein [Bacillota bacterium]